MTLAEDFDFTGRRILVTGAANGFGAAMADLLHAAGARLVLADWKRTARRSRGRCRARGPRLSTRPIPLRSRGSPRPGPVDTLINNAGVLVAKPLLETSFEEIRRTSMSISSAHCG